MELSSDSVSINMEAISPWGNKEFVVETTIGPVSVSVFGNEEKPAIVTYPDVGLNFMSCFQGLVFSPEASSLLYNFCIFHINPPGHEGVATESRSFDGPTYTADDLAEQIAEVVDFFGLDAVICMGVTAGAYILTLFTMKYRQRVLGLVLISPVCRAPSWSEWLYNKLVSNLLYFYGMCGVAKELLLKRYFSKEVRGSSEVMESEICGGCRKLLDERNSCGVLHFVEAMNGRPDISGGLKKLQCKTLIFVGEASCFHSEALHMATRLNKKLSALVEVQSCGSVVTEEQPLAMLLPLEYFLASFGFYTTPKKKNISPRSPLSPLCISPELLSPESLGLKLKPIKTRLP